MTLGHYDRVQTGPNVLHGVATGTAPPVSTPTVWLSVASAGASAGTLASARTPHTTSPQPSLATGCCCLATLSNCGCTVPERAVIRLLVP